MYFIGLNPGADPIKLFFLHFFFFGVKLGHFTTNLFLLYVTNMQAYQRKTEKFFIIEENKHRFNVDETLCSQYCAEYPKYCHLKVFRCLSKLETNEKDYIFFHFEQNNYFYFPCIC